MSARYAWIIDEDFTVEPDDNPSGIWGPRDATRDQVHALYAKQGRRFRMRDDDGELYYSGRIITRYGPGGEDDFAPLEDFGTPNAGCTSIEYLEKGKWVEL